MPEYIKRETAIKRVMETKWESGSERRCRADTFDDAILPQLRCQDGR